MKLALNITNRIIKSHVSGVSSICLTLPDFHQEGPAVAGRLFWGAKAGGWRSAGNDKKTCRQVAMTLDMQQSDKHKILIKY